MKRYSTSLVIGKCELNPNKTPLYIRQISKMKISENNKCRKVIKQREPKYTGGGSIIGKITLSVMLLSTANCTPEKSVHMSTKKYMNVHNIIAKKPPEIT